MGEYCSFSLNVCMLIDCIGFECYDKKLFLINKICL